MVYQLSFTSQTFKIKITFTRELKGEDVESVLSSQESAGGLSHLKLSTDGLMSQLPHPQRRLEAYQYGDQRHLGGQTLPSDSPVPSQDTVLDFLLLFFIHVWDSVFEELETGTEQGD